MAPDLSPVTAPARPTIDTGYPQPATARLSAAGEIDLATAPMLRDQLLTLLRDRAPAVLIVDLAGVAFLDCAGIRALVGVRNAAGETGCQMRVTGPQPFVRRVLEVTGLLGILTAPIEQPQRLRRPRLIHPSGTRPAPAGDAHQPAGTWSGPDLPRVMAS
ncbi:STAS domain-containing protein [Plantactinospora sp. B6F1]|uniref:STAS domain-containing protein n=1 Tax=Plantactinospora sp. B6F1 TaxID=3158971 RepID=UPI0032D9919E